MNINISSRAMLVSLTIRQWSATKHDKKVSADVAERNHSDANMGRYNKVLIAKESLQAIKTIANESRTDHYFRTLPWSDDGARILSSAGYFEYSTRMNDRQQRFNAAVNDFLAAYPQYVADARQKLNGLFNEADYPHVDKMRAKFEFKIAIRPMPSSEDFRVDLGTAETSRIKHDIEIAVNTSVQDAIHDVWARLYEVVQHMSERLHAYQVTPQGVSNPFRDSLVENVKELIGILPTLNLTHNPDLDRFANEVKDKLTAYGADDLRISDSLRAGIVQQADDILRKMEAYL